jgi:hypothetical protein
MVEACVKSVVVFLVTLTVLTINCTRLQELSPAEVANEFFKEVIGLPPGLPTLEELKAVWPMITPELQDLFVRAHRHFDKCTQEYPDEIPPWGDACLFSSLFEGPTAFHTGDVHVEGDRAAVSILFEHTLHADVTTWTDTLLLVRRQGRWLVEDIQFNGEWSFKIGYNLKGVLYLPDE